MRFTAKPFHRRRKSLKCGRVLDPPHWIFVIVLRKFALGILFFARLGTSFPPQEIFVQISIVMMISYIGRPACLQIIASALNFQFVLPRGKGTDVAAQLQTESLELCTAIEQGSKSDRKSVV